VGLCISADLIKLLSEEMYLRLSEMQQRKCTIDYMENSNLVSGWCSSLTPLHQSRIVTRGVASVRSLVCNLQQYSPTTTHETFADAIVNEFRTEYRITTDVGSLLLICFRARSDPSFCLVGMCCTRLQFSTEYRLCPKGHRRAIRKSRPTDPHKVCKA